MTTATTQNDTIAEQEAMAWVEAADYLPIECPRCHTTYRLRLDAIVWTGLSNTYGEAFHDRLQRLHHTPPAQLCAWCLIRGEDASC